MRANNYFRENLEKLKNGSTHKSRAVWDDGVQSTKKSIYQVFEQYQKGELPIHTYRETPVKSAIQEMLWIYKDQTSNLEDARARGINWWDGFDIGDGTIGKRYGATVHYWELLDTLLHDMATDPFSNRHIMSLWQEKDFLETEGLKPCAFLTQYNIVDNGEYYDVNMFLNIRSSDYITAGAINRIQYYALGLMICGHLTFTTGIKHELNTFSPFTNDLHIYDRHFHALEELLSREPIEDDYWLKLNGIKNFYDYDIEDFKIVTPKGLYKLSEKLEIAK